MQSLIRPALIGNTIWPANQCYDLLYEVQKNPKKETLEQYCKDNPNYEFSHRLEMRSDKGTIVHIATEVISPTCNELLLSIIQVGSQAALDGGCKRGFTPLLKCICEAPKVLPRNGYNFATIYAIALCLLGSNPNLTNSEKASFNGFECPKEATPLWVAAEFVCDLDLVATLLCCGAEVSKHTFSPKGLGLLSRASDKIIAAKKRTIKAFSKASQECLLNKIPKDLFPTIAHYCEPSMRNEIAEKYLKICEENEEPTAVFFKAFLMNQ